eukprot:TRINITY_DN18430_c1_g1_i1.p1 TRINITY_DN18430_c1_g1~~TRINITY_DN18430_c1_g1_i1.p1  ORF type:complete len:330 (-),score=83.47 TRINITY_DN18430_c1_g1_i1:269-1258(-)
MGIADSKPCVNCFGVRSDGGEAQLLQADEARARAHQLLKRTPQGSRGEGSQRRLRKKKREHEDEEGASLTFFPAPATPRAVQAQKQPPDADVVSDFLCCGRLTNRSAPPQKAEPALDASEESLPDTQPDVEMLPGDERAGPLSPSCSSTDTLRSLPEYVSLDEQDLFAKHARQYSIESQFSALDAVKRRGEASDVKRLSESSAASTDAPSEDFETAGMGQPFRWSIASTLSTVSVVLAGKDTVSIYLDKTGGESFGIGFKRRPDHLLIVKVCAEGLVPQWNKANPDKMVKPGDHVVKVNDVCGLAEGGAAMDEELDKAHKFTLEVRRAQ